MHRIYLLYRDFFIYHTLRCNIDIVLLGFFFNHIVFVSCCEIFKKCITYPCITFVICIYFFTIKIYVENESLERTLLLTRLPICGSCAAIEDAEMLLFSALLLSVLLFKVSELSETEFKSCKSSYSTEDCTRLFCTIAFLSCVCFASSKFCVS